MARKISFNETLKDARRVLAAWEKMPDFKIGDVRLRDFSTLHDEVRELIDAYLKKRMELKNLKHERDAKVRDLSDLITRARSGIYSQFGGDSIEYAQAGGTRSSDRKPHKRRTRG